MFTALLARLLPTSLLRPNSLNIAALLALQMVAVTGETWFLGLYSQHLRTTLNVTPTVVSNVVGVISLCSAITVHAIGLLYHRSGPLKLVLGSSSLMITGLWIVLYSSEPLVVYYGFFMLRSAGPDCIGFVSRLLLVTHLQQRDGLIMTVSCMLQMLMLAAASSLIHQQSLKTFTLVWSILILNFVTPGMLAVEDITRSAQHETISPIRVQPRVDYCKLFVFGILIFGFHLCCSGLNLHVSEIFTHPGFNRHNISAVYLCLAAGVLIGGLSASLGIRCFQNPALSIAVRDVIWGITLILSCCHFLLAPMLLQSYLGSVLFAILHGICNGLHVVVSETLVAVHFPMQSSGFVQAILYSARIAGTGVAPIFARSLYSPAMDPSWEPWMTTCGFTLLALAGVSLLNTIVQEHRQRKLAERMEARVESIMETYISGPGMAL